LTLDELLAMLPRLDEARRNPLLDESQDFSYWSETLPEFVAPDLAEVLKYEHEDKPQVMVVSAAGAVGKSTVAREISYRCGVPYWDLALAGPVGRDSFGGKLAKAFGLKGAAAVDGQMQTGDLFLVVDALDEARIKVKEAGFAALVADIANSAKKGSYYLAGLRLQVRHGSC
jgi:hypothetical protein